MVCFLFILPKQCLVQVLQHRHILRHRVLKIGLVNLINTAVDDCLFYRLQAFLAAHDQLAQGQDKICFQGNRIILFQIIRVDVHWIDILRTGRADFNNLPLKFLHQCRVLGFRIAHDYIIIRHQKRIGDFTLGRKGFTGTGGYQGSAHWGF